MIIDTKKKYSAAQVLRILRALFWRMSYEQRKTLWQVLTGLRGPDAGGISKKCATTGIIRSRVFGQRRMAVPADFTPEDSAAYTQLRNTLSHGTIGALSQSHFERHAVDAFRALGLKWEENNGKVRPI